MTQPVALRRTLNKYENLLIGSTFFLFIVAFPLGALAILAGASVTFTGYTMIMLLNRDRLGGDVEEREPLIRNLHKALGFLGVATLMFIFIPILDDTYQAVTNTQFDDFYLVVPTAFLLVVGIRYLLVKVVFELK